MSRVRDTRNILFSIMLLNILSVKSTPCNDNTVLVKQAIKLAEQIERETNL
jgi:hypothetical protein